MAGFKPNEFHKPRPTDKLVINKLRGNHAYPIYYDEFEYLEPRWQHRWTPDFIPQTIVQPIPQPNFPPIQWADPMNFAPSNLTLISSDGTEYNTSISGCFATLRNVSLPTKIKNVVRAEVRNPPQIDWYKTFPKFEAIVSQAFPGVLVEAGAKWVWNFDLPVDMVCNYITCARFPVQWSFTPYIEQMVDMVEEVFPDAAPEFKVFLLCFAYQGDINSLSILYPYTDGHAVIYTEIFLLEDVINLYLGGGLRYVQGTFSQDNGYQPGYGACWVNNDHKPGMTPGLKTARITAENLTLHTLLEKQFGKPPQYASKNVPFKELLQFFLALLKEHNVIN